MATNSAPNADVYAKFEPFRATEVWNEVLDEFRQKVPQIRCKKNNDETYFTGSTAVKTLETFLTENRQKLGMKEITKEKVVKLCQILINEQIIEPFQISSNTTFSESVKPKFQSTELSLYKFCAKKIFHSSENLGFDDNNSRMLSSPRHVGAENSELHRMWLTPNSCRSTCQRSPATSSNWRSFLQTPLSNSLKMSENGSGDRSSRHCKSTAVASHVDLNGSNDDILNGFDDNAVYDLALFRLLTVVEIPVLDGILQLKSRRDIIRGGGSLESLFANLGLSASSRKKNSVFDQTEISKVADSWLMFGSNYLADISSFKFAEVTDLLSVNEKRIYVFKKVVETTKKLYKDEPFFPTYYDDVLREIFELLTKKRFALALEACQLFILLLAKEQRRRFHGLVKFLHVCSLTKETRLSSEASNLRFALTSVRDCLVKCNSLSKEQILQFLDFVVGNCRVVLNPPDGFQEQLLQRQFRQMYTVAEPDPGISYCQRISSAQFERQKSETSEAALVQLVTNVVDDLTMTLAEKIEWLDNFKREYPELYVRKFNTLRW